MLRIEHKVVEGRELKRCTECNVWFELPCFSKCSRNWDGLQRSCKSCAAKRSHDWVSDNPDRQRLKTQRWRKLNLERAREIGRKNCRLRRQRAPEYARRYDRDFNSTPMRRLHVTISARIRETLRKVSEGRVTKSGRPWQAMVGYDSKALIAHLEKQFNPSFTWQNYGIAWEVDHIVPIAAHNFTSPNHPDFKRCWALKNLRPLAVEQNKSKGARLINQFQPSLAFNIQP